VAPAFPAIPPSVFAGRAWDQGIPGNFIEQLPFDINLVKWSSGLQRLQITLQCLMSSLFSPHIQFSVGFSIEVASASVVLVKSLHF